MSPLENYMEKKKYISKYETNLFVLDTVEGTSRSF